jgi:hypothetical protein
MWLLCPGGPLMPEIVAEYQDRNRERMQKLKEEFEADKKEHALKLLPDDGQ